MWKMELPLTTIKTPQSCSDYTLPIIRFIIGSFALFGLLESLWLRLVTPYPTDYRMGLIILGLLILIRFLISVPVESPLVENLVRIRRNLGLGKINVESARNEAEIALLGLSVSAALQKPLTQLLDMIEEQRVIFQSIVAEWQEVHKLWRQSQSNEIQLSEANILIEALGKSIEAHIAEHQQLKNKYHQRLHRFKVRTAILEGMSKDSTSEIDHLFSKIELGEKKIKDEMEEFKAQREREKDKFEEDRKKLSREVDAQKQS